MCFNCVKLLLLSPGYRLYVENYMAKQREARDKAAAGGQDINWVEGESCLSMNRAYRIQILFRLCPHLSCRIQTSMKGDTEETNSILLTMRYAGKRNCVFSASEFFFTRRSITSSMTCLELRATRPSESR